MSEEKMESVEKYTELASAIDESGKEISTVSAGNILEIQYHTLQFRHIGQDYVKMERTITPPSGWRSVGVSVQGWDLAYGDAFYEKALVSHMAARAGVRKSGNSIIVIGRALMREPTSVPTRKWHGHVTIQAIFTG